MALPRPDLKFEALAAHHDRDGFSCGVDSLDCYLRARAGQDVRRRANGGVILVYESFGFQPLPESLRLVLPMRSIEELLAR
jgi:hypothetical protein